MEYKVNNALSRPLHSAGLAWDRFWFKPIDSFNMCVIRILCGFMLLYTHLIWTLRFDEFFSNDGWNSKKVVDALQADTQAWSFWWYVPDSWMLTVHWTCNAILLAFALGFMTRTTSIMAWVIAVSYSHRATISTYGLDQINTILLFYLALAPCGQFLSIDAWLKSKRKKPSPAPSILANISTRLIQIHLCIIYLWAGLGKLQGESWWDGRAMWQAFSNYEYSSFDLTFLAGYPIILNLITHVTIAWEVFFCALVWNRVLRPLMLIMGVGMHFGIGAFLGMWTFGVAMTFGYLAFVPPERLRAAIAWLVRVPGLAISPPLSPSVALPSSTPPYPSLALNSAQPTGIGHAVHIALPLQTPTPKTPLIPFQRAEPALILVVRSSATREKIESYFAKHSGRVLSVDGFVEAGLLASVIPEPVVVDIDSVVSESELNMMLQFIRTKNPQTRFVFVGQDPAFANSDPGCIVVEKHCSLRQIRTAVEEVSGCTLKKCSKEKTSPNASNPSISATNLFLVGLLLSLSTLVGCSTSQSPALLLERARMLNDRGQTDQSLSVLKELLTIEPRNAEAYYLCGVAYEQQMDLKKAKEAYDACLAIAPRYQEALNNRGVVYGQLGESLKALDDLKAAIDVNPRDSLAWANLGLAQHELRMTNESLASYAKAIELQNEPRYIFQCGNVHLSAEQFADAEAMFTRAIEADKLYAAAYLNRANARYHQGLWEAARADLQSAKENDADLTLAPHIKSLARAIDDELWQVTQTEEVSKWLAVRGWETVTAESPFHLAAKNKEGEVRNVVVLNRDDAGQCLCDQSIVDAALETTKPLMLLIVEGITPRENAYIAAQPPEWLGHFSENWRPSAADFAPSQFRLLNPTISAQGPSDSVVR